MDVFALRRHVIEEYKRYVESFINIRDPRAETLVRREIEKGLFWPDPLIQLNPAFEPGTPIEELIRDGVLHPECARIFRKGKVGKNPGETLRLHKHQEEAIRIARMEANYVLTTGTGSGKSLSYLIPIVDYCLHNKPRNKHIKAVIVYPMNALANSQKLELEKFLVEGYDGKAPISFAQYTGQEDDETRIRIQESPPDILLTNFMMLELMLTRPDDRRIIDAAQDLKFLVLDELHTYRGRQGADVAMLVRRTREELRAGHLQCVGTSATLAGDGTFAEQQVEVARMATLLFGAPVKAEHVIGETLRWLGPHADFTDKAFVARLRDRVIDKSRRPPDKFQEFIQDPLSSWIENMFGLEVEPGTGRLRRVTPKTLEQATETLAEQTGIPSSRCLEAIQEGLLASYNCQKNPENGFPPFAFRLHQFLSRGDTVHSSLESEDARHLTVRGQQFVPGSEKKKLLFPLDFCRDCGQEYYRVFAHLNDGQATSFSARPENETSNDDSIEEGFLYLNTKAPWPADPAIVQTRVPPDWLDEQTGTVKKDRREWLPQPLRVRADGSVQGGVPNVAFLRSPFRFCLTCGVSFDFYQKSDKSKLGTLGIDRRSTATTILTLSALQYLKSDRSGLVDEARKLLSFTDNRQDASLQAGHFNDFVEVGLIRGGIFGAVSKGGKSGLRHDELTQKVFEALNLPFEAYSAQPEAKYAIRAETDRALRNYLGYLIYRDLRRGWRLTAPNLEQCGLIEIDYESLDDLCQNDSDWKTVPGSKGGEIAAHQAFASASPKTRAKVARVVLDYLRRELAIKVDYLDPSFQDRLRQQSSQYLRPPWAIDEDEVRLDHAAIAFPKPKSGNDYQGNCYLSARGGVGTYLIRRDTFAEWKGPKLDRDDARELIPQLFKIFAKAGLVAEVMPAASADDVPGYQVPAACILWKEGDGKRTFHDPIRMPYASQEGGRTNSFFVRYYREIAIGNKGLQAKEHTAQVPYEKRQEREVQFRLGKLPLLFCSPTMELGVDIHQLNVVNMRNVPPTPANYAQRSGRAGRSGQPALVFTYCTGASQHDQYFFKRPQRMVSGRVSTPRLDLSNQDLIRSHIQALWLSESGARLHKSLKDVLDVAGQSPTLSILPNIKEDFERSNVREKAREKALAVLATLEGVLATSGWYTSEWVDTVLKNALLEFENACQRWRSLFRSAQEQISRQVKVIQDASAGPREKDEAKRLFIEAESQLRLLTESQNIAQSDFYSYRYFASEGFLPGYNFPRLPLSAYIPGRKKVSGHDEFLSRPRFLAISEFGPKAFVYHEGSRYVIDKVIMPVQDEATGTVLKQAKLCQDCGYLHPIEGSATYDLCDRCGHDLGHAKTNLFRLQNVSTRRRDRISSDEEERFRQGFDLRTSIRFADIHGASSSRRATASADGNVVLQLAYGHSATLWRVNYGWTREKDKEKNGFWLDLNRGRWIGAPKDQEDLVMTAEEALAAKKAQVIPFVEDRRNCLLLETPERLDTNAAATLQYALKIAIQVEYQLEDAELASEPLPSSADRRVILLYEAAEGGAGVLRHLVDNPKALAKVSREALRLCHFDPDTGRDLRRHESSKEDCEAACYDCLLTYGNQRDHDLLDRISIRDILLQLARSTVASSSTSETRTDQLDRLSRMAGSNLEKEWLALLESLKLRLPSHAQKLEEACSTRPDFTYDFKGTHAAVYIDGPPHDFPERQRRDAEGVRRLEDLGWLVIRFHHKADWDRIIAENPSVFGGGSS